ncbi:MAG: hypothetical protein JO240_03455 [Solirubrobacterales bacterium]|nr:hypothetical protein [Solirubrobacterales bacterium]
MIALDGDASAQATAASLAGKLGASMVAADAQEIDLIVVGSQATAQPGRIALSGATRSRLSSIRGSVLVVPHGHPVQCVVDSPAC